MKCPYCVSDISDAALVCPHCGRDFYLFKPLLERIAALEERLKELPEIGGLRARIQALEERLAGPAAVSEVPMESPDAAETPLSRRLGEWVLLWAAPLLLLLISHAVITVLYDLNTVYLRVVSLLIPLPFGFMLMALRRRHLGPGLLAAFGMAALAVLGMSAITSLVDKTPVLPVDAREWREFVEYAASVGFSYTTGMLLGGMLRRRRLALIEESQQSLAFRLARLLSDENTEKLHMRVRKLNDLSGSLTAVATTLASIYTGLQGVVGK